MFESALHALGFDVETEIDLLAELEDSPAVEVPGFGAAKSLSLPSGARLTGLLDESWEAVPGFAASTFVTGLAYRATPYLVVVEAARNLCLLSDAAFALPSGNPAFSGGKQKMRLGVAAIAVGEDSEQDEQGESGESLVQPSVDRYYREFRPSFLNPMAHLSGEVEEDETGMRFVRTPVGPIQLLGPDSVTGLRAGDHFSGPVVLVGSPGFWEGCIG